MLLVDGSRQRLVIAPESINHDRAFVVRRPGEGVIGALARCDSCPDPDVLLGVVANKFFRPTGRRCAGERVRAASGMTAIGDHEPAVYDAGRFGHGHSCTADGVLSVRLPDRWHITPAPTVR